MSELYGWLISFLFLVSLLGLVLYRLLCFADLEFDFINPYDSAKRLNSVVLPEFATQGLLCITYLITGHWFFCLLCLPYFYYNLRSYVERRHFVDVTEIYNNIHHGKCQCTFKLIFLIALLSLSLFWLIWTAQESI